MTTEGDEHKAILFVMDTNWIEDDGTVRKGCNQRWVWRGQHSHWNWGNPTHWRRATKAEAQQYIAIWKQWQDL